MARALRVSTFRPTTTMSPFTATVMSGSKVRVTVLFAPSTFTDPGATLTFTPFGILTGNLPMRDTQPPFYQIVQISSPPAFFSRAFRPVVTPTEVVTMRVPKPLYTRGRVL
jgi:hypothetical protein